MKDKMPASLIEAMKQNKPIIFFINPPYATAASGKGKSGKKDVSNTMVYDKMLADKMGGASQNLYLQFFYRIMMFKEKYNLTNLHIGLFCPLNFLSGANRKAFRKSFFKDFSFNKGFLFNAGYFANCASTWGIGFSIWNSGESTEKENFTFDLVDFAGEEIEKVGEKVVYNVDKSNKASDWLRTELKKIKEKKILFPHLSNPLRVVEKDNQSILPNSIGGFCSLGNNINENTQGVVLVSGIQTRGTACITNSVIPQNFEKCAALFSARKLIESNWINSQDEYFAPNTESEKWNEFVNDSIVYSLFHSSSNQSSLRQVDYKGKKWDIKNEFFFMSKGEIMELANEYHLDFTYNDAKVSSERFVYNKLQGLELSAEAKAVLDKAIELTKKSFKVRELFNDEHPEYQILNWDAGYYQLKALWKEFLPNEYKEFTDLFKKLADKMRPMVYELGFLK